MKKIIILLTLIISTNFAFAQNNDAKASKDSGILFTSSPVTVINDSAKSTFEIVYTDFKDAIKSIAANLKVGAEHVYKVLIRQQIVKSISYILGTIAGIILLSIGIKFLNWINNDFKDWKKNRKSDYMDDYFHWKIILGIVFTLVGFVCIIIGIANFDVIFTGLINPEYGAIEDITKFIKH